MGFAFGGAGIFLSLANGTADLLAGAGHARVASPIFYVSGFCFMAIGALFLRAAGGTKDALRLIQTYE